MRWTLLLIGTLGTAACVPRPLAYQAAPPPSIADHDTRLAITDVLVPADTADLGAIVQVEGAGSVRITSARLAPARGEPCRGGWPAGVVSAGGRRRWERPLPVAPGERVTFEFPVTPEAPEAIGQLAEPETLDIEVQTDAGAARCVRLALPMADSALRRRRAWSWGGSLRLDPPIMNAFSGAVRAGRWLGPLRMGAELGLALRRCTDCLSPLYLSAPAALTIEALPALRAGFGVGLEAAYAVAPTVGADGGDTYLLHGPRLTVRLAAAARRTPHLPGGAQRRYSSVDFIVGFSRAVGVAHWSQTLFSMGFTWDEGF